MIGEVLDLVERRAAELEQEAGLWRRGADTVSQRAAVIARAFACNHPTGDIEQMLADIERGRDLR